MTTRPESSEPVAPIPSPPGPVPDGGPGPSARLPAPASVSVPARLGVRETFFSGRAGPWLRGLALLALPFALGLIDVAFGAGPLPSGGCPLLLSSLLSPGFVVTLGVELLFAAF